MICCAVQVVNMVQNVITSKIFSSGSKHILSRVAPVHTHLKLGVVVCLNEIRNKRRIFRAFPLVNFTIRPFFFNLQLKIRYLSLTNYRRDVKFVLKFFVVPFSDLLFCLQPNTLLLLKNRLFRSGCLNLLRAVRMNETCYVATVYGANLHLIIFNV